MKEKKQSENENPKSTFSPDDDDGGCGVGIPSPTSPFQDERGVCEKTTTRTQAVALTHMQVPQPHAPPTPPALLRYSGTRGEERDGNNHRLKPT